MPLVSMRQLLDHAAEHGYGLLHVFRLTGCEAAVWTMADNFRPTTYRKI